MSSITTAIPTGALPLGTPWCMSPLLNPLVMQKPHPFSECANSSAIPPTVPSDFQTICCDGVIIDTTFDIWGEALAWVDNIRMNATANWASTNHRLNLDNLVCCREAGATQVRNGRLLVPTKCDAELRATPLASLAATNTNNAELYIATYYEGRLDMPTNKSQLYLQVQTPTCLFVPTAHEGVTMTEVQVPGADITTLPLKLTNSEGRTFTIGTAISKTTTRPLTDGVSSGRGSTITSTSTGEVVKSTSSSVGTTVARTGMTLSGVFFLGFLAALAVT
jgi:hypothetical protein